MSPPYSPHACGLHEGKAWVDTACVPPPPLGGISTNRHGHSECLVSRTQLEPNSARTSSKADPEMTQGVTAILPEGITAPDQSPECSANARLRPQARSHPGFRSCPRALRDSISSMCWLCLQNIPHIRPLLTEAPHISPERASSVSRLHFTKTLIRSPAATLGPQSILQRVARGPQCSSIKALVLSG